MSQVKGREREGWLEISEAWRLDGIWLEPGGVGSLVDLGFGD